VLRIFSQTSANAAWIMALVLASVMALVLLASPSLASKVKPPADAINMDQAIAMAMGYSPNLTAAKEDLQRAKYQEKEAFTYFLPTLSTNYSLQKNQNPTTIRTGMGNFQVNDENTYRWSTGLSQPVFTGLRLSSQYRLAELGVDIADVNVGLTKLDLVLKVKEAYFEYLRAQKSLKVAKQAVVQLKSQLKVSQDFYDVGIIPINDVLKTKVELANQQQDEVAAQNAVDLSRAQLARLLGMPVETRFQVEDILRYRPISVKFMKARDQARAQRPELKALNLQLEQADYSIQEARSGYYPEIGLSASYDYTSDSPDMQDSAAFDHTGWTVGAQLDWAFWEWGRTHHKVSQQQAARRKLVAVRQDLQDQVDLQVKQAILFLVDSAKNIVTAKASIEQAKENYRITMERYKEQLTTNTELLDAQILLTQAQNNYFTALTVYNVAEARLWRAMGLEGPGPQAKKQ
jgi:outer membrane protein